MLFLLLVIYFSFSMIFQICGRAKGAEALGSDMNFRKAHGSVNIQHIIPIPTFRQVTLVSGIRNLCQNAFCRGFFLSSFAAFRPVSERS